MTDAQQQQETRHVESAMRLIEAIQIEHAIVMKQRETIRELEQKLLDATESDRRPKYRGFVFDVYHQEDIAFIRSYLNRKRVERSYEFT
ncbi:hypothetical protein [Pseudomonas serbica]|uniref:hypothetical protein n=1 Tax=Pseudomonas serbica TaxID=2965074 RepID=UPI0039E368CF